MAGTIVSASFGSGPKSPGRHPPPGHDTSAVAAQCSSKSTEVGSRKDAAEPEGHSRNLTAKQRRFCEEYLVDLNATQAAIRAGYSPKTARIQASQLMAKRHVRERIAELQEEASERTRLTTDRVLADLEHLYQQGIERNQIGPAVRAKELQGKHLGMFVDVNRYETSTVEQLSDGELIKRMAMGDPVIAARLIKKCAADRTKEDLEQAITDIAGDDAGMAVQIRQELSRLNARG